jgi:WbqC-like protein family
MPVDPARGTRAATPLATRTLVVLQPGYLPWLGFFDQMHRSDVFVYYDDVQFDKHGWRNRNRIKTPAGALWLTVPVRHAGLGQPRIMDTLIDGSTSWARKHVRSIRQYYAKAPFLNRYLPEIEELLERPWAHLADLDIALAGVLAGWLSLEPTVHRASALGIAGDKSERLLNLCRHFGADRYLSGNAAQDYLEVDLFTRHGVAVEWQNYHHPVYPQQHGQFMPFLSALDLLLNCGDESASILKRETRQ